MKYDNLILSGPDLIAAILQGGKVIFCKHDTLNWHLVIHMPKTNDPEEYRFLYFTQMNSTNADINAPEDDLKKCHFSLMCSYRYQTKTQVLKKVDTDYWDDRMHTKRMRERCNT